MSSTYKKLSWRFWWQYAAINLTFWLVSFLLPAKLLKLLMLASIFIIPLILFMMLFSRLSLLTNLSYASQAAPKPHRKLALAVYWRFIVMTVIVMVSLAGALTESGLGTDYLSPIRLVLSLPIAYIAIAWALKGAHKKGTFNQ